MKVVGMFVALALGLMLAGCGNDGAPVAEAAPEEPETTLSAPVGSESFAPENTFSAAVEKDDGSTADVEIEVGKPIRASEFDLGDGFEVLPGICATDTDRSALLPVRVVASNTTSGFPIDLSTGIHMRARAPAFPITMEAAQSFNDGSECEQTENGNELIADASFDALEEGGSGKTNILISIPDYYTPADPDGYPDVLAEPELRVATGIEWEVTCVSGPGVWNGWFYLDGSDFDPVDGVDVQVDECS